jgi:NAD(P)-dependent dehydrogenase (short-subunit alcohol dehydrogenase family)
MSGHPLTNGQTHQQKEQRIMERTLEGKRMLVTGATSGMGKVTALRLAQYGASVVIVGRNAEKTEATVQEIRRQAPQSDVQFLVADLSSLAQVRALAQAYQSAYPRLDVLINNAGGMFARRQLSVDGLEMTFALNVFAPFLLTHLLLDTLKASAPARIITVASATHAGKHVPFDDLTHEKGYKPLQVYAESKLMAIMFTYALARRLEGTGVSANALHPGVVATHFGKDAHGSIWPLMVTLMAPFSLSPEKGAQTAIYLASSPDVATVSGKYFVKSQPARSSDAAYDVPAQQRLWAICERLTGLAASDAVGRAS